MDVRKGIALGLLVLAGIAGAYLAGWLALVLLGVAQHAHLEWNTWWQYFRALGHEPRLEAFAFRIRLAGWVGFGLPLLAWLASLYPLLKRKPRSLHGDARFASRRDLAKAGLFKNDPLGIVLGRSHGRLLRLGGQRHVIVTAPTRSGKTAGVAIPVLLTYRGSVVALDIKGELYATTSGWRHAQGQQVYVWSPYAEDRRGHRFNPLQCVSTRPDLRVNQLQTIAAALYPDDPQKDTFWVQQARNAFFGLAAYLFERWDDETRRSAGIAEALRPRPNTSPLFPSFERVLRLAAGDGREPRELVRSLMAASFVSADTRTSLASLAGQADETFASIIGSLQEPLVQFLNPLLAEATNACDFSLSDLRRRPMTLYVVVPPSKLGEARKLLNIFFSMVVGENTGATPREDPSLATPCVLLMDEFTSMGRVDVLAASIAHTAGYGLRSLPIIQSLAQLDATYGADVARTFMTNHGASVVFTPREQHDAEQYSKMLGDTTVTRKNRTVSRDGRAGLARNGRSRSWTETAERRALMLPQEIKALPADKEIIFLEGIAHPILADKIRYYADRRFRAGVLPKVELPERPAARRARPEPVVRLHDDERRLLASGA